MQFTSLQHDQTMQTPGYRHACMLHWRAQLSTLPHHNQTTHSSRSINAISPGSNASEK
jgi:hypothetical protein